MTRITFRHPNYKNGKSITLKISRLDDSKVYCNQCGAELTQKEIIPSFITFFTKETEGSKDIHKMEYVTKYLCFNCIEKLTERRPDNE